MEGRRDYLFRITQIAEIQVQGYDMDKIVVPAGDSHIDRLIDGGRHDKPIIIIRMLPDQVYPARRPYHHRISIKSFLEFLYNAGGQCLILLSCYHMRQSASVKITSILTENKIKFIGYVLADRPSKAPG